MSQRGLANRAKVFQALAVVCALAVGLAVWVQSAHFHPDGNPDNEKHCSVCSAAHVAMPAALAQVSGCQAAAIVNQTAPENIASARVLPFSLFNRPPPPVA